MVQARRWTSAELVQFPDDGQRYEIIDGALSVAKAPHAYHQSVTAIVVAGLVDHDRGTRLGRTFVAPGVLFSPENDVIPDIAWIRRERLPEALDPGGHFRTAPDLIVEVLSSGLENEQRDRVAKLKLYSQRGVREYWIVDWRFRRIDVFRRRGEALHLATTLSIEDTLTSPLLPGFSLALADIFADIPLDVRG
jgi:Uma2 family endonuclease